MGGEEGVFTHASRTFPMVSTDVVSSMMRCDGISFAMVLATTEASAIWNPSLSFGLGSLGLPFCTVTMVAK